MIQYYDYEDKEENLENEKNISTVKSRAEKRKIKFKKKSDFAKKSGKHKIKVHGKKSFVVPNYRTKKQRVMVKQIHNKTKSAIREENKKIIKSLYKENGEYIFEDAKYAKYEQYRKTSEPKYLFG